MAYRIQQSTTAYKLCFLMVDSTDHVTGKTGLTPTVTLSKNGAAFASPAGAVSELASGWYVVAGNATDSATLGPLLLHATGTAADPTDTAFEVVVDDLTTSALRPTTAGRTLDVATTGEAGLDYANINIYPAGAFAPGAIVDSGTAQSATATTVVLRAAAAFADTEIKGASIVIRSATAGAGQSRLITAWVNSTKTATVDAWTTTPTGTIVYDIFGSAPGSTTSPVPADVRQILGTAVSTPATAGILDTNVKNINNVAAATPGAAGGVFIAGTNAATTVTTSLTTTFTGNLTGSVGSVTGAVGSVTGAVGSVTTVNDKTGYRMSATGVADILTTALVEAYAADGAAGTLSQILFAIQAFLQEKSVSGTTMTVKKLDGVTSAMTFTLDSATLPTTITRAT